MEQKYRSYNMLDVSSKDLKGVLECLSNKLDNEYKKGLGDFVIIKSCSVDSYIIIGEVLLNRISKVNGKWVFVEF